MRQVLFRGQGSDKPSRDIMGEPADLIDIAGDIVFGYICIGRMWVLIAGWEFMSFIRTGQRAGVQGLAEVDRVSFVNFLKTLVRGWILSLPTTFYRIRMPVFACKASKSCDRNSTSERSNKL